MQRLTFEVGDTAYIHTGGERIKKLKWFPAPHWIFIRGAGPNPLKECTVVHKFDLYGEMMYVCEIPTHIDPVHYVRDGFSMSDNPKKAIGLFRRNK